ncbi:MAG: CrcB family protein [Microthrixaceae bacterium]
MSVAVLFVLAAATAALARVLLTAAGNTSRFPWGTLAVNVTGSFLAAVLAGHLPQAAATVLGVAALGSFTTFSTFSVETAALWGDRRAGALGYLLATVLGAVGAALVGLRL